MTPPAERTEKSDGGQRKTRIQLPPALRALCGRAAAFSPGGAGTGGLLSSRSDGGKELRDSFSGQRGKKSLLEVKNDILVLDSYV